MARRRNERNRVADAPVGKSRREARMERLTWAGLVLVFAITQFLPEGTVPNWFVPLMGAVILLVSGLYQYTRGYNVSPFTWIGGTVMLGFVFYNLQVNPARNFFGPTLIIVFLVLILGVVTGET